MGDARRLPCERCRCLGGRGLAAGELDDGPDSGKAETGAVGAGGEDDTLREDALEERFSGLLSAVLQSEHAEQAPSPSIR